MALNPSSNDQVAQAAASLQLLLKEDKGLGNYGLTNATSNPDEVAFPYASALLLEQGNEIGSNLSTQQRASAALQDVERKLALVEALGVKLSRTSPEAVAGHLLRLYGFQIASDDTHEESGGPDGSTSANTHWSSTSNTTLYSIRERSDRLERQAETLETVVKRVESSLTRGLTKMESSTLRLSRVLKLSSTLKRIMLLQFETNKLQTYDLDDLRDLPRAAASVAILEDLLKDPEFSTTKATDTITIIERIRPQAMACASAVRSSASALLNDLLRSSAEAATISEAGATKMIQKIGATLQVYHQLGEIHDAVWKAINHAHDQAHKASKNLFNATTVSSLPEKAKKTTKDSRLAQNKLKQLRVDAAQEWADCVLVAATFVRNVNRVLCRKTDHGLRQLYIDVVARAPVPIKYSEFPKSTNLEVFIFQLFWARFCHSLSQVVDQILEQENGRYWNDASELYPAVRAAGLGIITHLLQTSSNNVMAGSTTFYDYSPNGVLGGTMLLDDVFLGALNRGDNNNENPQSGFSADSWTSPSDTVEKLEYRTAAQFTPSTAVGLNSFEWEFLEGNNENMNGIYPLKQSFVDSCFERLCAPLQYMFPDENVNLDSDGLTLSTGLSLLPSKYDIQRFDETIRNELALADPRESGTDHNLVKMIAQTVVSMISEFCKRAKGAMSGVNGETGYIMDDLSMSENLEHDRKLVAIFFAVRNYLTQAPEKTFIAPYRPAVLPGRQDLANLCQDALNPALLKIDENVTQSVLLPLCKALNRRIFTILSKIGHGAYLEVKNDSDEGAPGFIQGNIVPLLELISKLHLSRFPTLYALAITEKIASFTIYSFLSLLSLVRNVGEGTRLRMTQDLADLELALDQLVSKTANSVSLHDVEQGKPYAELRAVRNMLFWTGLEDNKVWSGQEIAKLLLREMWIKDVRPSTLFHYLFSFGPSLLSSPYQAKQMKAEDYVSTLIQFDGSVGSGEGAAWLTIMSCCDSFLQRATANTLSNDGDARIAHVVLAVGLELSRSRQ